MLCLCHPCVSARCKMEAASWPHRIPVHEEKGWWRNRCRMSYGHDTEVWCTLTSTSLQTSPVATPDSKASVPLAWGFYSLDLPFLWISHWLQGLPSPSPHSSVGKESACNPGDQGSIPGSGRSPKEGNGNPFQYSCPGNLMNTGAWQTTVHVVAKPLTQLTN